jgi:serine phosphatase RsbU (regulator of sigma subunit)
MKVKSLSKQLSMILILGVTLVSLVTYGFIYKISMDNALAQFDEKNIATTHQLLGTMVQPVWNINIPALKTSADNFTSDNTLVQLDVLDEFGESLYTYKSDLFDNNITEHRAAIIKEEDTIGQISLSFSKNELDRELNQILINNIAILMLTLTTITLLTLVVFKTLLKKPLDSLIQTSIDFGNGNYTSKTANTYKEFEPLIGVLGTMGNKISKQLKQLNEHKTNLEIKINDRTKQLAKEKQLVNSIMDSQESIIITSDGSKITTINRACIDFFSFNDEPILFEVDDIDTDPEAFKELKSKVEDQQWLNDIYQNKDSLNKINIKMDGLEHVFSISIDRFLFENKELYTVVFNNITELESIKDQIEEINTHTRQSIEYSALIQNSLIPGNERLKPYFDEFFVTWQPKDTIGGDIYLFDELRSSDECLFMVIDCTGHGVPGAFLTMLVKAIEKQVVTLIKENDNEVNTADVLKLFNREIKSTLKQDRNSTLSNAGFDGGIIYYNKKQNILRFSGANTPLYYVQEGELSAIKGDRYSVGYKTSDINYEFTQHTIKVSAGMNFYLTTDGYIDQNGGAKGFPFGKRKFEHIIRQHYQKPLAIQQEIFSEQLSKYQEDEERNDDITLMAIKI